MQIKDSRFHKVWKVTEQDGRKQINLGDSKKQQDGTYKNWTWFFCNLVGNAKGIQVEEGDTITINSAKIEMYQANSGEWKNSITIFDFEVTAKAQGSYGNNQQSNSSQSYQKTTQSSQNFEDSIPF